MKENLDQLIKDAARYQFLRSNSLPINDEMTNIGAVDGVLVCKTPNESQMVTGLECDYAVDLAISIVSNSAVPLFYLQDSRSYVGNDVLWWARSGGYTTDLSKAETYTREEAQRMHDSRPSDIPWPKNYIDLKVRPAVDMQYIKKDEALDGTGIKLAAYKKPKNKSLRCVHCGSFVSEYQYCNGCPTCGGESR